MTRFKDLVVILLWLAALGFLAAGPLHAQTGQPGGSQAGPLAGPGGEGTGPGSGNDPLGQAVPVPQPDPIVLPGVEGPFYPTLAPNGLQGYANAAGILVINGIFLAANPFLPDGTAWVNFENAFGKIDTQGRWVKEPRLKFLRVSEFYPNGLAEAQAEDGRFGFIDAEGEWAIPPTFKRTRGFDTEGLAPVMGMDSLWGFIDSKGNQVIEARYSDARHFAPNGLALVKGQDGLFGFLDREGRMAIEPRFTEARPFAAHGLAPVKPVGQEYFGLIDQNGDMVVEPKYSRAAGPSSNDLLALADKDGLWGFTDLSGNFVIGPKYKRVGPFGTNGLARFRLEDGSMGLLNELDQWVLEPLYLFLGDFTVRGKPTEYTPAHSKEGLWGLINQSGEWEVLPGYAFCTYRLDGLVETREHDSERWGYYNLEGQPRVPFGYDRSGELGAQGQKLYGHR
ncbi:MAG: WG repeat-containing protein [Deltaproteobacteria bacterium]|nr:WG repeat-containing protein [Deltaproteobacteria bacterium]